jgi:hypothetical protein
MEVVFMNDTWKAGLVIVVGLTLAVFLVWGAVKAINEWERVVAVGVGNLYSQVD